jgi:hypothetical protein
MLKPNSNISAYAHLERLKNRFIIHGVRSSATCGKFTDFQNWQGAETLKSIKIPENDNKYEKMKHNSAWVWNLLSGNEGIRWTAFEMGRKDENNLIRNIIQFNEKEKDYFGNYVTVLFNIDEECIDYNYKLLEQTALQIADLLPYQFDDEIAVEKENKNCLLYEVYGGFKFYNSLKDNKVITKNMRCIRMFFPYDHTSLVFIADKQADAQYEEEDVDLICNDLEHCNSLETHEFLYPELNSVCCMCPQQFHDEVAHIAIGLETRCPRLKAGKEFRNTQHWLTDVIGNKLDDLYHLFHDGQQRRDDNFIPDYKMMEDYFKYFEYKLKDFTEWNDKCLEINRKKIMNLDKKFTAKNLGKENPRRPVGVFKCRG